MSPSDELAYLKSLVNQLTDKIKELEVKSTAKKPPTPAQQLRTILVGPPGAGARPPISCRSLDVYDDALCVSFFFCNYREGHAGAANTRRVLRVPPRDGRHATRASGEEDGTGRRGQENHGCWWARLGRHHGGHDSGPVGEQQAVQERVRNRQKSNARRWR